MQPIEKRIAALEDSASDKGLKLIVVLNGEGGACGLQLGQVMRGPVPRADTKAHLFQAAGPPCNRAVAPQHFCAGGELERHFKLQYILGRLRP